jgi:hypothetical protein
MSPDQTLARIRELAGLAQTEGLSGRESGELALAVLQLDDWLQAGGYWPARWSGRGVNLDLGELGPQVLIEVDKIRGLLDGKTRILASKTPQLIVAMPLVKDDGRCVAGLASHAVFDPDPAKATRELYVMLREAVEKTGQA